MATLAPQVPLGHAGDDAGATCEFGTKQLETETAGFKGNQLRRTEDVAPSTGNFGAGDMATLAPQIPFGNTGDIDRATGPLGTKQLESETAGFEGIQLNRTEDVAPSTGNFGACDTATLAPQIPFGNAGDIDRATGPLGTKQLESETAGFKGNQLNRTEDVAPSTGNFGAGNMATLAPQSETAGFKGNQLKRTGEVEQPTGEFQASSTRAFGTRQLESETAGFRGTQLKRTGDVAPSTGNFGAGDIATLAPQVPFGYLGEVAGSTGDFGTKQFEVEAAAFKGNQLKLTGPDFEAPSPCLPPGQITRPHTANTNGDLDATGVSEAAWFETER